MQSLIRILSTVPVFSKGVVCRTKATSPPPSTRQRKAPRKPAKSSSLGSDEHRPAPPKQFVLNVDYEIVSFD